MFHHSAAAIESKNMDLFHRLEDLLDPKEKIILTKYQPWNHEIKLEAGAKLTAEPIYWMTENELKALKTYIDENLKRKFIRPSFSKFDSPVLLVPKKDTDELRVVVDYR
jgi:hypothetical protein